MLTIDTAPRVALVRQANVSAFVQIAGSKLRFQELAKVNAADLQNLLSASGSDSRAHATCHAIEVSLELHPFCIDLEFSGVRYADHVAKKFAAGALVNGPNVGFVRLANLRLLSSLSSSPRAFAKATGVPEGTLCSLLNASATRLPGDGAARNFERCLSLRPGTLDVDRAVLPYLGAIQARYLLSPRRQKVVVPTVAPPLVSSAAPVLPVAATRAAILASMPFTASFGKPLAVQPGRRHRGTAMAIEDRRRANLAAVLVFGPRLRSVGIDPKDIEQLLLADSIGRGHPYLSKLEHALGFARGDMHRNVLFCDPPVRTPAEVDARLKRAEARLSSSGNAPILDAAAAPLKWIEPQRALLNKEVQFYKAKQPKKTGSRAPDSTSHSHAIEPISGDRYRTTWSFHRTAIGLRTPTQRTSAKITDLQGALKFARKWKIEFPGSVSSASASAVRGVKPSTLDDSSHAWLAAVMNRKPIPQSMSLARRAR